MLPCRETFYKNSMKLELSSTNPQHIPQIRALCDKEGDTSDHYVYKLWQSWK